MNDALMKIYFQRKWAQKTDNPLAKEVPQPEGLAKSEIRQDWVIPTIRREEMSAGFKPIPKQSAIPKRSADGADISN